MKKRNRKIKSVADELIIKSREAALAAVQIFNNPTITFKSELFIVTMNIAWTYLLHAYYRKKNIQFKYFEIKNNRRIFQKTKSGANKYWELEKCLNVKECPIDNESKNNLKFLIGIRHEIEHQMTKKIDVSFSAKFQACCLNFNRYIKNLFDEKFGIDKYLSFSLQFSTISHEQYEELKNKDLPKNIETFVKNFEKNISDSEFESQNYAYRVLFVEKIANRKGQADKVIEFVKGDSEFAKKTNAEYEKIYVKEVDKKKYRASDIIKLMKKEGVIFQSGCHVGRNQINKLSKEDVKSFFHRSCPNILKFPYSLS